MRDKLFDLDAVDGLGVELPVEVGQRRGNLASLILRSKVPLEFGRDGKLVNAIEAEAVEHSVIEGELLEVDADTSTINVYREEGPEGQPIQQSFIITADTIIWLDGKATKLVDLKPFSSILLRMSDDAHSVRAIKAQSPEPDDEEEESDDKCDGE